MPKFTDRQRREACPSSTRTPLSIQRQLVLLLLLVLIPIFIAQVAIHYERLQATRRLILASNLELARAIGKTFEGFVRNVLSQELAIGIALTASKPLSGQDVKRLLQDSKIDLPAVRCFGFIAAQGHYLVSSAPAVVANNIRNRPYFRDIVAGKAWQVSNLTFSQVVGAPVFIIARGIRNAQGVLLGVVFAAVVPDQLQQAGIERTGATAIGILDKAGIAVYHCPHLKLDWEQRYTYKDDPMVREGLQGSEASGALVSGMDGRKRMVAVAPIASVGWVAMAGVPEDEAIAQTFSRLRLHFLCFSAVALTALVLAFLISRRMVAPIKKLHRHALLLGQSSKFEEVPIEGALELQELARAFNTMTEEVRAREKALLAIKTELERRAEERTADLSKSNAALKAQIAERERAESSLRESETELRFLSSRLLSAQEDERKRIAGEIHDSLGSTLSAIKMSLENIRDQLDQESKLVHSLAMPIGWTQHAMEEARRIMADLRPSVLDDIGLLPTLNWLFKQYRSAHPSIQVAMAIGIEEHDIPEPLKIVIFRIIQEALHNIGKHSQAEFTDFSLVRQNRAIELTIEDNGVGFDLNAVFAEKNTRMGLGLTSMRERAELSGGKFSIRSAPGKGTRIHAVWPIKQPA